MRPSTQFATISPGIMSCARGIPCEIEPLGKLYLRHEEEDRSRDLSASGLGARRSRLNGKGPPYHRCGPQIVYYYYYYYYQDENDAWFEDCDRVEQQKKAGCTIAPNTNWKRHSGCWHPRQLPQGQAQLRQSFNGHTVLVPRGTVPAQAWFCKSA
jgi:hypothetical protein